MFSQRIIQFWIEEFRVDGKLTALSRQADLDALFARIPDLKTIAANRKSYWRKVFRQRAAAHIFGIGRPDEAVAWPSDDTPNAARTLAGKFRLGANDIVGYADQYQTLIAVLGQTEAVRAGWLFRQLMAHFPPTVVAPYDFSIYAQAISGLGGIKRMITPTFLASFGRKLSQCATAQEALDWVNLEEQVGSPGHINREAFERYRQWGIENFAMLAHVRNWINTDWPRAAPTFNPAWCDVPVRWAAQLYEGHSPAAITGGDLTRVELRRWIASGTDKDARWWVAERIWRMHGLGDEPYWLHNRGRAVATWLVGKWGNAAMTKPRHVPQHVRRWANQSFRDLADYIEPADLTNGQSTAPDVAFANAFARLQQVAEQREALEAAPFKSSPFECDAGVRYLVDRDALINEGRELDHCVAGYADACRRGQSFIYSVTCGEQRSTLEIKPNRQGAYFINQHRGARNQKAPALCAALIQRWAEVNGITQT